MKLNLSKRKRWAIVATSAAISLGAILAANLLTLFGSSAKITNQLHKLTPAPIGIVLGCPPNTTGGGANAFFESRMNAAALLYKQNKVKKLLLSGSAALHYNEPAAMRTALIKRGVPEDALLLDPKGNRTIDSIQRAIEHYGLKTFIIISQGFHTPRAVFLANYFGADARGFNAEPVRGSKALRILFREHLARLRVFIDLWFLGR